MTTLRSKSFILASIKMDLFRVVTATGNISQELPRDSVLDFLHHADRDFEKITLTEHEAQIRQKLRELAKTLPTVVGPHDRLRWAENILTLRCRL